VNTELLDAVQLALAGQSEIARQRLAKLWQELPPDDFFHRCVLAHYLADLQEDLGAELHWDQLALEAALIASSESFDGQIPDVTRAAFLPSLHLNLASSYERNALLDLARQQAVLARDSVRSLPSTPLGETTRAAILRICSRLGV
jgi:hypothetical protein